LFVKPFAESITLSAAARFAYISTGRLDVFYSLLNVIYDFDNLPVPLIRAKKEKKPVTDAEFKLRHFEGDARSLPSPPPSRRGTRALHNLGEKWNFFRVLFAAERINFLLNVHVLWVVCRVELEGEICITRLDSTYTQKFQNKSLFETATRRVASYV
jgi:hypothetical protein